MKLSIIIVSWNVKEKLQENLKAIFQSKTSFDFDVFVVDNNSSDGSVEMVENSFPEVRLIKNKENFGFAKANNHAILQTNSDFVLLLNPDMKLFSDTLGNMLKWMEKNEQVSVAGCKLVDEKGSLVKQIRRFPQLFDQLMIVLKVPHVFSFVVNKYLQVDFNYEKEAQVDSIRGAFFLMRRSIIEKLKGLDERYFVWFEEVDYCRQVKNIGEQVWYTPTAKCVDYVGQSFNQVKKGQTQNYFMSSQLKYFKKWHTKFEYYLLRLAWMPILLLTRGMFKK